MVFAYKLLKIINGVAKYNNEWLSRQVMGIFLVRVFIFEGLGSVWDSLFNIYDQQVKELAVKCHILSRNGFKMLWKHALPDTPAVALWQGKKSREVIILQISNEESLSKGGEKPSL